MVFLALLIYTFVLRLIRIVTVIIDDLRNATGKAAQHLGGFISVFLVALLAAWLISYLYRKNMAEPFSPKIPK